jgi:hypothetical protein
VKEPTGVLMGCRYQLLGGFKMNREEFEQEKETGVEVEEQDAAVQEEEIVDEVEEVETDIDDQEEDQQEDSEDDLDIPEEQKPAFAKRLEREQKKIKEQTEKELEEKFEQKYKEKYSKHDSIIERLGGDPDQVEKMIQDNLSQAELQREAQYLADQYGWDDDQTSQYVQQKVEQQRKDQELQELKVQVSINELKDNPDYAGIGSMKKEIQTMISRSGGAIDVKQAYWALGGEKRAEQLRRETEQRNIAKRSKAKRTVQSDSPTSTTGEKPLDAENERIRQKMGLSLKEAKALLNDTPNNLEAYRKKKG